MSETIPSTSTPPPSLRQRLLGMLDVLAAAVASASAFVLAVSPWTMLESLDQILAQLSPGAELPAITQLFVGHPWMPLMAALPLMGLTVTAILGPGDMPRARRRALLWATAAMGTLALCALGFAIVAPFLGMGEPLR